MPGNKTAIILSLVLGLIASGMVFRIIKKSQTAKVPEIPKIEVVCAKTALPARSEISASQLELRKIPAEGANPNIIRSTKEAVGLVTKSEIYQGEPLLKDRLLVKGQKYSMSFLLPEGMRAITVAIDEVKGVAGFVKPGERVDVVGTFKVEDAKGYTSWTLVQDVAVLAVAQDIGEPAKPAKDEKKATNDKAKVGSSVTLAVTPQQAQQIALGEEMGVLRLVLRPLLNDAPVNLLPLAEGALLPKPVSPSQKVAGGKSTKRRGRQIEVISGGKSYFITVY